MYRMQDKFKMLKLENVKKKGDTEAFLEGLG